MNLFLFQTAMSVPSLKMLLETFIHQYDTPKTPPLHNQLWSQVCFEHFGVLLDVDRGCGLINNSLGRK